MENIQHNVFIIDDKASNGQPLQRFLNGRFGEKLQITTYQDMDFALSKITKDIHMVILDRNLIGNKNSSIVQSIKLKSPKTEVIVLTSNEDVSQAIDAFRKGASDYLLNDTNTFKKTAALINKLLLHPVIKLLKEFRVRKYLYVYLLTFLTVGLIVYFTLLS